MAVDAACFRSKLAGEPIPAGERPARVLAGYRRTASDRGRGQARPFGVSDLAAVLATCHRPRRRGRGVDIRSTRRREPRCSTQHSPTSPNARREVLRSRRPVYRPRLLSGLLVFLCSDVPRARASVQACPLLHSRHLSAPQPTAIHRSAGRNSALIRHNLLRLLRHPSLVNRPDR